jgi:PEP-CTERM motif
VKKKTLATFAAASIVAASSAHALLTASFSSTAPSVFDYTYSFDDLSGNAALAISGGTIFSPPGPAGIALQPQGGVGKFWSLDPSALPGTSPGKIAFKTDVTSVTFLWGSPDSFNNLVVDMNVGPDPTITPFATSGLNSDSRYLTLTAAGAGEFISGLTFRSEASNTSYAFEVDNLSLTAVPEPQTYALLLAGLGAVTFMARRRRPVV